MTKPDYTHDGWPIWRDELDYWQKSARYTNGYAYVIRAGNRGPIKAGKAMDPEQRLAELQTGAWQKLTILHVLPGYGDMERRLHRKLKGYRIRGEWFDGEIIPSFLVWLADESTRLMTEHEEKQILPTFRPAPRDRSVTVTFVDPAEMDRRKAARSSPDWLGDAA